MINEDDPIPEEALLSLLQAARLTARYKQDLLTGEEKIALQNWLQEDPLHQQWLDRWMDQQQVTAMTEDFASFQAYAATALNNLSIHAIPQPLVRRLYVRRWAAAVIMALVAGIALTVYFLQNKKEPVVTVQPTPVLPDIAPAGNKAILILADGSRISLDSAGTGSLAQQEGTIITKTGAGSIAYSEQRTANAGTAMLYNTITTPRGGQYHVVLPDGSKVWLNAASSLRYPTTFKGKERKVEITGEVYFEVAPLRSFDPSTALRTAPSTSSPRVPFIVTAKNMTVEVLGTHFNINAYDDEASINTTLLEGSVRVGIVNRQSSIVKLTPGQQSQIPLSSQSIQSSQIQVQTADIESVMAWKNGFFVFENKTLEEVMREISRWYDLDIVYEGKIPAIHFGGRMGRDVNLAAVLKLLKGSRVHFEVADNGKKLIVRP